MRTRRWWLAALLPPMLVAAAAYGLRLEGLAWYALRAPEAGDWEDHRVAVEARPLEGLRDLSGLTYNHDRHTLFSVLNSTPLLVELSLEGEVLRRVRVEGVEDMEGITHVGGNRYVIVDERRQDLVLIELDDDAEVIDAAAAPRLQLGIDRNGNKGFEGVAWDPAGRRLLVVKERDPLRLLAVTGFVERTQPLEVRVTELAHPRLWSLMLRDLSSVSWDDASNQLVLLSDESRLLVSYQQTGQPSGYLALWRGFHGLGRSVPQAEGLALGPGGDVFVVSEPNLFYSFRRNPRAPDGKRVVDTSAAGEASSSTL